MARAEISSLFNLKWVTDRPVTGARIGSGLSIGTVNADWLLEVKKQCPKIEAREQIEWTGAYTHRVFYEVAADESTLDNENPVTSGERQLGMKAIVLSRLVKPTSIGYDSVWVKSFYRDDGTVKHYHNQVLNNLNVAFVIPGVEDWNTITATDAELMAELWDSFQFLFDNEQEYRRVVRAIKTNEIAYSIYFPEMGHTIMHAALESLICTGYPHNRAQVTQRLPKLVSFVSEDQAADIYELCGSFKHAAEAMLQQPSSASGEVAESDQKRINAVHSLRRAVRDLLIRALRDQSFAKLLADKNLLRKNYPVYDRKNKVLPV
jgi:hypothetical protein